MTLESFLSSEDPIGEGGDFSTNACDNAFDESNGICLLDDCIFRNSRVAKKGAVIQIGSGTRASHVQINGGFVTNASCGKVSSPRPKLSGKSTGLTSRETPPASPSDRKRVLSHT